MSRIKCRKCMCSSCALNGHRKNRDRRIHEKNICLGCGYCYMNDTYAVHETCRTYKEDMQW